MRSAIGLILAAIVCVALAWYVSDIPGTFSLTVGGYSIQTSTPVAILLAVVLFLVLYALLRLLAWLVSLPRRTSRWRAGRARSKGDLAVNRALIALAANDGAAARREADRSRRLLGDTPITLLLAAQAERLAGHEHDAAALYEMLAERKDSKLLGMRGLLRLAVEREDWERATAIATEAERSHPTAKWLRDERRFMAQQTGSWREALRLSGPDAQASMALEAARTETDPKQSLALAKQAFTADPGIPAAAVAYAEKLRAAGNARGAHDVLRRAWEACPHPDIAAAFVADVADPVKRAQEVAVLARNTPHNPESAIAVARAALDAGLPEDARRTLDRARAEGVNEHRFWALLAEVCAAQGDEAGRQDALQHLPGASPDPVWRCTVCNTRYEQWHGVCQHCRSTGSIRWTSPSDAAVGPAKRVESGVTEGLLG